MSTMSEKYSNKSLIISLNTDLDHLNSIIESISSKYTNKNQKSWFFPNKNYDTLSLIDLTQESNLSYLNCLELIIDRLYVIISLVTGYMNHEQEGKRNIRTPGALSLGNCVQIFWNLIDKKIMKKVVTSEGNRECCPGQQLTTDDQEVQTEVTALNRCDSCAEAVWSVKKLTTCLEKYYPESITAKERATSAEHLFNMTQVGTMILITNYIEDDLETIVKELKNLNNKNKELIKLNENLKSELDNIRDVNQCKLDNLEMLNHELSSEMNYYKNKNESLNKENTEDKMKISSLSQKVKKLRKITRKDQRVVKSLKCNALRVSSRYKTKLKSLVHENDSIKDEMKRLTVKYEYSFGTSSKMQQSNFIYERNISQMLMNLNNFEVSVDNVSSFTEEIIKQYDKLNNKIVFLMENYNEEKHLVDSIINKYKEVIQKMKTGKVQDKKTDTNGFKIQGVPLLDMTQQVEANIKTIKELEVQNKKFQAIINIYQKGK